MRSETWKRKEIRKKKKELDLKYNSVRVIGGLGSWGRGTEAYSKLFMLSLSRALPYYVVHERLRKIFNGSNRIEHISTPLTKESLSYAFRLKYAMKVKDAWNKCVEALSDLCLSSNR